ncbi:hypothetical protein [Cypionkella sp.]|uniref:hypothetical protein n=1 Tax=Cypionkella sp. TaxID=2811411 RepID=UPI00271A19B3|nr:hypothetical protein [Cypionkella sp.]MDO8985567.1 hypothetical protein [Cypionkella sp.]MDP2048768.1 hypothetical protein [Cypionkella sp.]
MKDFILFASILTAGILGFIVKQNADDLTSLKASLSSAETQLAAASADKVTAGERTAYGSICVDWIKDVEEKKGTKGEYSLGRSWKKHGQFVFEVMTPAEGGNMVVCTYDEQSGVVVRPADSERSIWMFYE